MAPASLSQLSNPLASFDHLSSSGSQLDGVPADLEDSVRFAGARLTQQAGVLLKLPQDITAKAVVLFTRFWIGAEGGSLKEYGAKDISAACLYLVAKLSPYPKTPRLLLNTYAYLDSLPSTFADPETLKSHDPDNSLLDENSYQAHRTLLVRNESHILRVLGFETHVALPHALCITYLQTLDVFGHPQSSVLSQRAVAHLNTALLSPQLVYLTHQPNALATAAIYLAAREVGVKLPGEEWWEVFDTDREELGFLVVAMLSVEGFVAEEKARWGKRKIPLTVDDLEAELESRSILDQNVTGI